MHETNSLPISRPFSIEMIRGSREIMLDALLEHALKLEAVNITGSAVFELTIRFQRAADGETLDLWVFDASQYEIFAEALRERLDNRFIGTCTWRGRSFAVQVHPLARAFAIRLNIVSLADWDRVDEQRDKLLQELSAMVSDGHITRGQRRSLARHLRLATANRADLTDFDITRFVIETLPFLDFSKGSNSVDDSRGPQHNGQ